jgi:hypothetical protein
MRDGSTPRARLAVITAAWRRYTRADHDAHPRGRLYEVSLMPDGRNVRSECRALAPDVARALRLFGGRLPD